MHKITLQQFEGPLDLLLSLIEDQKLSITEISLATVTEQFLKYVKQLEQIDPTAMADYLHIAAKLLVIKSKAILPTLEIEDEEEETEGEDDLASRLLLYKQFKEAAKAIKQVELSGSQSFTRSLVFSQKVFFWPDPEVKTEQLHKAILQTVASLKALDNLPKAKVKEAISIQEKISHLQRKLSSQVETKLSDLLKDAKNKSEVIITFLALLELIKQRMFSVEQDELFTDITITQFKQTEADGAVLEVTEVEVTPHQLETDTDKDGDDDETDEDEEEDEEEEDDEDDED